MAVLLETSIGDLVIDLYTTERPNTCLNFLKLCKTKYYNFCLFHSVQRNLVAQTGDPTGTGRGGECIFRKLYGDQAQYFEMEATPRIKHKKHGTVSMVNNGNGMHGSQFFITLAEDLDYLDGVHTVFGEVAEGLEVLSKINETFCDKEHRPYRDIRIYHTVILDDPYDDPPDLEIPPVSPLPTKEQLESSRIGDDEEIDDTKGLTQSELKEMTEDKEEKANAQILEMVGDLPDAEVAPPDNVLFVCKLNPITTAEDLEIIFSRFGNILSCEVVRDQKTKESLQYAFIEFEKPEDCEQAYFKMDNVLIDDRRIHVDFSQSVAKVKWKGKGKGVEHTKPETKYDGKPQYVLKDRSWKSDKKYDLVFEEDEQESVKPCSDAEIPKVKKKDKKKKKKKKHKKHKKKSSSDDDSNQSSVSEKHSKKSSSKSKHESNSGQTEKRRKSSPSPDRSKSKSGFKQGGNRDRSRSPISRGPNRGSHSSDRRDYSPDRKRDYEKTSSKDRERKHSSKSDFSKHSRDKY